MSDQAMKLARRGLRAWKAGDFATLESMVHPEARWRAVVPDEWDCNDRAGVVRVLRERHEQGFARGKIDIEEAGIDRVILVSHPAEIGGDAWPAENAMVVRFRDGMVVDIQDYPSRDDAFAAAR